MTRYYVQIASSLVSDILSREAQVPAGWSLVERWGPKGLYSEIWLAEDRGAPAEFEGCLVEVSFRQRAGFLSDYPVTEVSDRVKRAAPWLD